MNTNISSLYIHFPFCRHLCNYCDFFKYKLEGRDQVLSFEQLLLKQWERHQELMTDNNMVISQLETLYLGGGTPSLWKSGGPKFLRNFLKSNNIFFKKEYEFTIEVDPGTWTKDEVKEWIALGVNRFSIGSQAFSDEFLKIMDREHDLAQVIETVEYMQKLKVNFSVDLMLGLPHSEARDLKSEIDLLLSYEPEHLSVYILKARKNYPLYDELPDEELVRNEYLFVSSYLKEQGFDHYEISNFARQGKYSQHNIKYWDYNSVAALGPNGTGLIARDSNALRYQWKSQKIGFVVENLEGESLKIEKLFLGLRTYKGFDINKHFPEAKEEQVIKLVNRLRELSYLEDKSTDSKIYLNTLGFLMCDSIIDEFFKQIDF